MSIPPIPAAVIYSGLVGVLLALIVATAQNKWQPRVFVLLALRLAIGWHFLFEGLHKLNSTSVGETETNKPFSSEPYFKNGEGPFAEMTRKQFFGDPVATYTARTSKKKELSVEAFSKLGLAEKAELCPDAVAAELKAAANGELPKAQEELNSANDGFEQASAKLTAQPDEKAQAQFSVLGLAAFKAPHLTAWSSANAKRDAAKSRVEILENDGAALRASYAAWVYGAAPRDAKFKRFDTPVPVSPEQWYDYIEVLQKEKQAIESRQSLALGHGDGTDVKKAAAVRADLQAAQNDFVKAIDEFVAELKKEAGIKDEAPKKKPLELVDTVTRWMIVCIGIGLLAGLFTRIWCLAGIGFLVMTYLSAPPFPWLPPPPPSEGNPLFINKNLIEAIALLVILVHPTGRWLGLDALWQGAFGKKVKV